MRDARRRPAHRLGRPARVRRAATRCPSRCGPRSRASCRRADADDLVGHAGARHRRRRARPARAATASTVRRRVAAAPASRPTCFSYRRDGAARPAGSAGLVWMRRVTRRAARDEIAANLDAVRAPDRRGLRGAPAATPTRSPWSWSPSSSRPPTYACSPSSASPTWGRTGTRRPRPRRAECADLGLRWHFIGGLQSNKAAAVAAYADVVESVDRAKLVGAARPRAPTSAAAPSTCLVQVSLDPPGRGRPRRAPTRPTSPALADAVEAAGSCGCAG